MSRIGAFFDVDRTMVACNTGRLFLRDLRRRGEISFLRALRAMGWMVKYHLSLIDLRRWPTSLAGQMAGGRSRSSPSAAGAGSRTTCCRWSLPGARAKIEQPPRRGARAGDPVDLADLRGPAASPRCWASRRCMSTQFEVDGGLFTGRLIGPGLRRQGQGPLGRGPGGAPASVDLSQSWFYTDSYTDMPMLERVGNRVVVQPGPAAAAGRQAARLAGSDRPNWCRRGATHERLFGPLVHAGGAAPAGPGAGRGRRPRRRDHRRRSSTRPRRPRPTSSRGERRWSAGWASSRRCSRASTGARACA